MSLTSISRLLFLPLLLLLCGPARAADKYVTKGDCGGYPRLQLSTAPGLCVGLVASGLGAARGVAVLGASIYIADMAEGWQKNKGRLLRLPLSGRGAPEVLLERLNEPNALLPTDHGTLYIGELGKVIEFDPRVNDPKKAVRDVVVNLPSGGRHPLPALVQDEKGMLYINVGSATDNCEQDNGSRGTDPCPETRLSPPRATIIRILPKADAPVDAKDAEIVARGLRNSLALSLLPGGKLAAAVNARDAIDQVDPRLSDEDLPHDTLDWIEPGADYGWPYCFDDNRPSPEYAHFDCRAKHRPTRLLPPHAAPLGMLFYKSAFALYQNGLVDLTGNLVIAYHGYRAQGHRIVMLRLDAGGNPKGDPVNLVWNWQAIPGRQPLGAPVAMTVMRDGTLLVTEDHNGTLLRIAPVRK